MESPALPNSLLLPSPFSHDIILPRCRCGMQNVPEELNGIANSEQERTFKPLKFPQTCWKRFLLCRRADADCWNASAICCPMNSLAVRRKTVTAILDGMAALQKKLDAVVIVTNEVFTDRVPNDVAMQQYLQNLGNINQVLASRSDVVIEVCSGIPICWKGVSLFHEIML